MEHVGPSPIIPASPAHLHICPAVYREPHFNTDSKLTWGLRNQEKQKQNKWEGRRKAIKNRGNSGRKKTFKKPNLRIYPHNIWDDISSMKLQAAIKGIHLGMDLRN